MPVLAICRGAQVLNVARGGTLHQHLPDLGPVLGHRQDLSSGRRTHRVALEPNSQLARLLGMDELRVNSFHHQAVAELGHGLRVVARSADGIVEAIEGTSAGFVVGVQWHAECLVGRSEQRALFKALAEAASVHVAARAERAA
jgi:putative glutamine amidotransferase